MAVKVTARKYQGDCANSWAIFRSDRKEPIVVGLSKPEIPYYKKMVEKIIEASQKKGR